MMMYVYFLNVHGHSWVCVLLFAQVFFRFLKDPSCRSQHGRFKITKKPQDTETFVYSSLRPLLPAEACWSHLALKTCSLKEEGCVKLSVRTMGKWCICTLKKDIRIWSYMHMCLFNVSKAMIKQPYVDGLYNLYLRSILEKLLLRY